MAKAPPRKKGDTKLSGFAYVDSKGVGHLPLYKNGKLDAGHVANARARFNQTHFESPSAKAKALAKIEAAEKKLGIGQEKKPEKHAAAAEVPRLAIGTYAIAINDATGGDGSGPPEWVKLLSSGTLDTRDTRGPFIVKDAAAIVASTMEQLMKAGIPFDINHSTDFAAPKGGESPAAGWIRAFEIRGAGEIWGQVEWTARGKQALSRGPGGEPPEYRYMSPVFLHDENTREIQTILRAALTNNPNLYSTEICARNDEMKKQSQAKIAEAVATMAQADPELKKALKTICAFGVMLGLGEKTATGEELAAIAEMAAGDDDDGGDDKKAAKPNNPVAKAFAIISKAAEAAGISIAHFLDALTDMANGDPEAADEIDEDDMSGLEARNGDMSSGAGDMASHTAFVGELKVAIQTAEKAEQTEISARLRDLLEETEVRIATMTAADRDTRTAINDAEMDDAQCAAAFDRMAAEHTAANKKDDADFCRKMAKKHRDKHEEAMRAQNRKDAETAATAHTATVVKDVDSKIAALAKENDDLKKGLAAVQERELKTLAAAKVDRAIEEGKVAPAQRDWAIGHCMESNENFDAFLKNQPALIKGADGRFEPRATPDANGNVIDPFEATIISNMQIDPAKYAVQRKSDAKRFISFGLVKS